MIDKLYSLINEASKRLGPDWTIIFANQNAPRPVKPYIALNVLSVDIPDHVIYSKLNSNLEQTVSGWRKAEVELQIFNGISSLVTVNTLSLVLQTENLLEYQQQLDCSIGQRLFIGYVPELINLSQFEGRGIYQFSFFYTEEYTEVISAIDQTIIHGDYIGSLTDLTCDEIVTGPHWDIAIGLGTFGPLRASGSS